MSHKRNNDSEEQYEHIELPQLPQLPVQAHNPSSLSQAHASQQNVGQGLPELPQHQTAGSQYNQQELFTSENYGRPLPNEPSTHASYVQPHVTGNVSGHVTGHTTGHTTGGYDSGYNSGYNTAQNTGYHSGYNTGHNTGHNSGYNSESTSAYVSNQPTGHNTAYTGHEPSQNELFVHENPFGDSQMNASSTSFDPLSAERTDYSSYQGANNPFNEDPFDESLNHALQMNSSSNNLDRLNQLPTHYSGYQNMPSHTGMSMQDPGVAGIFDEPFEISGDSYHTKPIDPNMELYDNNMNKINLAAPQSMENVDDFLGQGVFVSQNVGQGVNQQLQMQIEGVYGNPDDQAQEAQGLLQDEDNEELRYGPNAINKDALFLNNLTLDCPIPTILADRYKIKEEPSRQALEFVRMKYTAVTSPPERFLYDRFSLRQQLFKVPRVNCELMIVVTMYNEDDVLLGRTLKGVFDNIKYICRKANKEVWGPDGWKRIVVAIVSDGRTKINPRARALLANLGVYQEGFAQSKVLNKDVTCHLYEHTTLANIQKVTDKVYLEYEDVVPVQLIFALKEKNQKKINSHRWCFQALAPALNPNVIVLFDAGTEPTKKSIYNLWREFHLHPNVGGACGEIKAMLGPKLRFLWNGLFSGALVAAQNFEYKMSNILDKPTESAFGFISVLPGAFSAYRYEALKNDPVRGSGPLQAYFKGETLHQSTEKHDLFANNMYLAEDRILCFEIVTKKDSHWVLRYVNTAAAATDVPDTLAEFISQRRRWLNGSFFAAVYSIVNFGKIFRSDHNIFRKLLLFVQFIYNVINIIVSWFSIGSFFLVFRILTLSLSAKTDDMYFAPGKVFAVVFLWIYIATTMCVFVFAFGNKPKGAQKAYWLITIIYALIMVYMIFCAVWLAVKSVRAVIKDNDGHPTFVELAKNSSFRDLVVSLGSTYALYFISSFMYFQPWHMFTSFLQYMLLSPMYTNVLNIYAFCNIHDVSWGTKGEDGSGDKASVVKKAEGKNGFVLNIPTTAEEVNELFTKEMKVIDVPLSDEDSEDSKTTKGDYYQLVRSIIVVVWCLSNGCIIALVLAVGGTPHSKEVTDADPTEGTNGKVFLTVILWLVAGLAAFRFLGSTYYLLTRIFGFRRQKD